MELASGELAEYFNTFNTKQARELYQERIYRKTASLFSTAGETGSLLGGAPEPQVQALRNYGKHIGLAFQMVDDLLDVQGDAAELGKPVGRDLAQGVLTLPTIMLMEKYPDDNPIEEMFKDRTEDGMLHRALEMINNSSIIADCFAEIRKDCDKATRSLEVLPDCEARRSLLELSEYTRERSR
ncbi:MAG: polyprenyl synthetase family protein [Chloroflexi bacterium]|nr:polyprenyl synthetase family protein [Chloroflexota bacterium]